jgi:hypothetical protein
MRGRYRAAIEIGTRLNRKVPTDSSTREVMKPTAALFSFVTPTKVGAHIQRRVTIGP